MVAALDVVSYVSHRAVTLLTRLMLERTSEKLTANLTKGKCLTIIFRGKLVRRNE